MSEAEQTVALQAQVAVQLLPRMVARAAQPAQEGDHLPWLHRYKRKPLAP